MYINETPNPSGAYSAPQSNQFPGSIVLPEEMVPEFLQYNGFVVLTIQDGVVTGITPNTTAWEAWKAGQPDPLPGIKEQRIQQTKTDLATYLESHPLQWTDGNYYSITEEKQNQLSRVFAVYEINLALGKGARLEWNDTGERCREWSKEELSMLASAIDERVRPLVKYQQEKEIEIRGAATLEEVNAVVVDYDTV